ncbi:MAG: hypothetical protein AAFR87_34290 [Bacteroidota bacterium]
MRELKLETLKEGFPAISKSVGAYLAEGGAYCLEAQGHASGVLLELSGAFEEKVKVLWPEQVNNQIIRAWADSQEATEFGAIAVAILILQSLTNYTVIERSFKGTGFDYWLGVGEYDENRLPFEQRKARLEVSGIWRESKSNTIDARIELKKQQVKKSDDLNLPVLIIVVEFKTPKSKIFRQ